MRYSKLLACAAVAVVTLFTSVQAKAEDRDDRFGRSEFREQRDIRNDYARVNAERYDVAADRARLNEDLRCGRLGAAAQDRRDIARDQEAIEAQYRDIRHDRRY